MAGNAPARPTPTDVFAEIIRTEVGVINRRRTAINETDPAYADAGRKRKILAIPRIEPGAPVLDVTALTLSGGGIRSASFSLGVLQALNEYKCLPRIDYLSTVSGGGYMGSALSATMTKTQGDFVFGESTGERSTVHGHSDIKDTPAVGHLRNYSNYLVPFGVRDLLTALAIVIRGLVANIALVLPVILLLAALTIFGSPDRSDLVQPNIVGIPITWLKVTHFGVTLLIALLAFPFFFGWAIWRSLSANDKQAEFRTWLPSIAVAYLLLVATSFFCELQPYLIAGMFELYDEATQGVDGENSLLTAFIKHIATIAAPIAAIVTVFRQQVGTLLKSVTTESGVTTKLMVIGAHAAIWIAGAALPLLICVGYLYLCFWGIINDGRPDPKQAPHQAAIHGTIQLKGPGIDLHATVDCGAKAQNPCGAPASDAGTSKETNKIVEYTGEKRGEHTPAWIINPATALSDIYGSIIPARWMDYAWLRDRLFWRPVTLLYTTIGFLLFVIAWFCLMPNANSLHRLYRDRLSKAFLFDPTSKRRGEASEGGAGESVDLGRDFAALDTMRISALVPAAPEVPHAPYHLINAALNIQGSDFANRRGRNADFFLFSPCFVGSEATGYAGTAAMEEATALDLPTAMAISGAAFSSNMGSSSIKALTPTLALLNVRTGYWLRNPLSLAAGSATANGRRVKKRFGSTLFLWSEITGRLYEDSEDVYITDGGHIENLGVYELLRRRCRVIVVVDAEADPAMRMPSLVTLQRYARIDLGVRINMPWDAICKATRDWMGYGGKAARADAPPPKPSSGPHAAIGTIDYDNGGKGWLVYIKSSLSGDENDYVRDYARRYEQFPHESTGDQFFSEEQFEVYRALGFHIASRLLGGDDEVLVYGRSVPTTLKTVDENVDPVRAALLG